MSIHECALNPAPILAEPENAGEKPLECQGCGEPINDLANATGALPNLWETGLIDPLHRDPCCGALYREKHGTPDLWLTPDSLAHLVGENLQLATEYPGRDGSLEKTEKGLGHKTLRHEIARAARWVAKLYEGVA